MEHRIVQHRDVPTLGVATGGEIILAASRSADALPLVALLPPAYPEWLGDRSFHETHGVRFAYVGGEMARGIASADLVIALARSGMLGFFGAAGLSLDTIEANLARLDATLTQAGLSWGANLIHTTGAPEIEERTVDLMLKYGVRRMSASAFMKLSPAVVRYACHGLRRDAQGRIERTHHVFAKISRPEVARHFLEPPPRELLQQLVDDGHITHEEATLAAQVPLAEDLTIEADSGGHTDNRPLTALFPAIAALRDEIAAKHHYVRPIRLGAAGGLGTPDAIAAAFALGAAYVLIGSVHQSAVEAGLSVDAKRMLTEAGIADVAMTAAADMFEAGVKVQVLKRGTLMAPRGNKLHQLFRQYESLDAISPADRAQIERDIFRQSLDEVWRETEAFFREREPVQLERAAREPKHRMALVFRWYLGQSSRWPIAGTTERRSDYQIWCGPAMGAFNVWARGSYLEALENRAVQQIALNLMEGAAVLTRAHQVRSLGVPVASSAFVYRPKPLAL
jgi:trans-AT polyketide synthase/acyltransferase/oxidoreductase domain-containing protein